MIEKIIDEGGDHHVDALMDKCLMIMACHGAIRANQQLSQTEMKMLLSDLDTCDDGAHCPHGRPTWIRLDLKTSIERSFKRIV